MLSPRRAIFQTALVALVWNAVGCAQQHDHGAQPNDPAVSPGTTPTTGTDAAAPLPSDEKAHVGAQASVKLESLASAGLAEDALVTGEAVFAETSSGVDMQLKMRGCVGGSSYPLTILQGSDCSAASLRGPSWDAPRGDDIVAANCNLAAGGPGRSNYTRAKSHPKPWSIGTPKASNLLGHAMIISDSSGEALACGVIGRTPDVVAVPKPTGDAAKPELGAFLAGICLYKTFVRDSARACPDPVELSRCSREHCQLDQCAHACSSFLTCLGATADPCQEEFGCEMTQACSDCRNDVSGCTFTFCTEEIACAPPTAVDGPCAKLEACCAMQGDGAAQCLDVVRLAQKLSGDSTCVGFMHDWDTVAHLKVPCKFE